MLKYQEKDRKCILQKCHFRKKGKKLNLFFALLLAHLFHSSLP